MLEREYREMRGIKYHLSVEMDTRTSPEPKASGRQSGMSTAIGDQHTADSQWLTQ
jgi:hypothetical protein